MSFFAFPPEINAALMSAGAGAEPLLAAASAWDALAAELESAAESFSSITSELVGGPWQGASAAAMSAAAAPYAGWLSAAAAAAVSTAGQARAVTGAFEAALAATVDPLVIAANRTGLVSLVSSNIFGQNAPAIAATEADYELMWAQDVAAMAGYHLDAAAAVSGLRAFGGVNPLAAASVGTGFLGTSFNPLGGSFDLFPITLPLQLNLDATVGPISIQPIRILPTIPLNFNQTLMLGPLSVPPIHVPEIPLAGISIPIDIGPLSIQPITVFPGANIPSQSLTTPAFDLVPGGILLPNVFIGSGFINVFLNVDPIPLNVGVQVPPITLFPGGLNFPATPLHLDVGLSARTGSFTIPGFSLPEHPIPVTISMAGQIDSFSTPAITMDAIPAHLNMRVSADRVVPLFPLPAIPLHIDLNGTVGALNVHPIAIPAAHVSITNATASIGSFTVPQIDIPQIPLHVAGTVGLGGNTIPAMNILDPLNATAQLSAGLISGPHISIPSLVQNFGGPYVVLKDLTASAFVTSGNNVLTLGTTALATPDISIPAQTPVQLELLGGIDSFSLFPGGLTFPTNSVSLVDFTAGSGPFTVFPNGFRVDQFPFNVRSEVLSPTPGTTGGIGPIHIPGVPVLPPIHLGGTGDVKLNLGLPSIPLPAITGGLHGDVNYGFITDQPINIRPFGIAGNLATAAMTPFIRVSSFPLELHVPVIEMSVIGTVASFDVVQHIPASTVPIDFSSGPITIAPISYSGSTPLSIPFDILSANAIPGITHIQSIPLDFAVDTSAIRLPDTTIPVIPIGGNNVVAARAAGLLDFAMRNVANAGPQVSTSLEEGVGWASQLLQNAGLGNAGSYNLGSGNFGDLNFGDGNIGRFNIGGGNIGSANFGWGNSALREMMGSNFGFGNSGSGNIGFGNSGSGNVGFGNSGNGNMGVGLIGDNRNGFGGWNSGSGNIGLFNSGTGNWGLFNSGTNNSGFGNSGQGNSGLFNAGEFSSGVGNAGSHNTGLFNAGSANLGAFNPGNANSGLFNSGDANTGVANSGTGNNGAFITGNHSVGGFLTGDHQGPFGAGPGLGINLIDINENFGPVHIDPIHIPGVPINLDETFYIGPFTIPQVDVPAVPIDIRQGFTLPAVTLFDGINMPAQHIVIPFSSPAGTASSLQLPVIKYNAQTNFGFIHLTPQDFYIGQSSDPRSITNGQPTQGIRIDFGASSARSGSIDLNLPAINIPKIATSPIPVNIDVQGGLPAFTLFPGGLSLPENSIPVNLGLSGGLEPLTFFPDGYTIDPIPLQLKLDATVLNPIDGIPPSLNLVNFHAYGGMGQVTIPDLPIPKVGLGLTGHLDHGAFTIPPIAIPNVPIQVTGDIGVGPIGIASQHIPAIMADPIATIHFGGSQSSGMKISPFYIWTPTNAAWDAATGGPAFIAFGTNWQGAPFPLPTGPLIFGGSTQEPWTVTINGGTHAFNTPAVMMDRIPLGFEVPGGVDGATFFPGGLSFPANNLLDLNLSAGSQAFTIPARVIPAIPADFTAIIRLATPDSLLPPYKWLYVNGTGFVGPAVFPSFHIPSIPLGFDLGGGIGPVSIPSFTTPPISLGLSPTTNIGPVTTQPFSLEQLAMDLQVEVSEMRSGASTSEFAFRVSGVLGAIIDLGGTSAGSKTQAFGIPPFTVITPPGGGIPGIRLPFDPINIGLPLSVTVPSMTFPGLTISNLPVGLGLSGGTPAFDLPAITIDRIPFNLAGPLTLL